MNLIELQNQYDNLQKGKKDLEAEILEFNKWEELKKQYLLKELSPGIYVYLFKDNSNEEVPTHYLCAKCFENQNRSILQLDWISENETLYTCSKCKNRIRTDKGRGRMDIRFRP